MRVCSAVQSEGAPRRVFFAVWVVFLPCFFRFFACLLVWFGRVVPGLYEVTQHTQSLIHLLGGLVQLFRGFFSRKCCTWKTPPLRILRRSKPKLQGGRALFETAFDVTAFETLGFRTRALPPAATATSAALAPPPGAAATATISTSPSKSLSAGARPDAPPRMVVFVAAAAEDERLTQLDHGLRLERGHLNLRLRK